MDPLTHTLFGAALADTGLKRVSRHATAALVIGASLPDVDALAYFLGSDAALYLRRGWSHGVLSMLVLPLLLTGAIMLWARWRLHRDDGSTQRTLRPAALLGVACLAVWSHPLLDWMNTYGIRLLMPFDGRWFYGDALFIVDPWLWLMLGAGVVVARSARVASMAAWVLLAAAASWLLLSRGLPHGVAFAWIAGIALVVALRWRLPATGAGRVAQVGLAAAIGYGAVMFGLARHAEARALERFPDANSVQASPVAALPLEHRIVLAWRDRYRVIDPDGAVHEYRLAPADRVVQRALADASIRGFATWMRFPWWQVEPHPEGWRVRFHDLRYSQPGNADAGIGYAEVVVPRE